MDSPAPSQLAPIAAGPFKGSLDSLKQNRYPAWFTEGKLGIWAHWGPQAVPMEGDWYARLMYEEGSKDYKDHVARYGHPTERGYKDIIPLWKAEKWDPERLMKLYKAAGATYFVSMGAHHDNFDLWNSTYHRWNAVKMGPHRDVVGAWAKAARANGLRFGVSEHLGASWTWFQKSRGSDKEGPRAGIPYDGADPAYSDMYHPAALPGDDGWYSTDPRWHHEWYRRVKDLIDQYHPDLLYSDGPMPFGTVGESLVAHFYNVTMKHGEQQAVYTCKQPSEGRWAQDVERGVLGGIQEFPWQTDTSIGDWFYNKDWKFRGADWVIHTLVDVVSKNGNLLINVVQRPDGSLDAEAEQVLTDMAAWMQVNGESIYGTTPWLVFGEGPTRAKGGAFKEDFDFSARDIRYVQKGEGTIYATLMGPVGDRSVLLRCLAKGLDDSAMIRDVSLLGKSTKVEWKWDSEGLHVTLPKGDFSKIASVLRIDGARLRDFRSVPDPFPSPEVNIGEDGAYRLRADTAALHGNVATEARDGTDNLGYWDQAGDFVSWTVNVAKAGTFSVTLNAAGPQPSSLRISVNGSETIVAIPATGAWDQFVSIAGGTLDLPAGKVTITAKPVDASTWHAINLRSIALIPKA